ncbi:alpha-amylase family glycosyl hydrolase [Jiangella alkaliphila]|uniref:Alpha amylase, catalytic domain n=1 Tax=Jiangella alkaliphila TaxID=419479 RepID=A0A1H2LF26_9ACTN|nr:alpha-amylase family glycosyl hydrolase [Jiangella alkaliphila]SDU79006.1 Alpha amylase, catalytic domain [Jiangella alkaliphila]
MRSSRFGKGLGSAFGLVLSAAVLASTLTSAAGETQVVAAKQHAAKVSDRPVDNSSFQNLNGFMWFYNTYFDYKFSDIEDDLRDLKSRGIRVLGFFAPYNGGKHWCDGCAPYDFYSVPPQNGTMEDWESLVDAAHKLDMKVVAYFANIYMDEDGLFFRTAEQQYAAGDRTSREVASFRWTDDPTDPLPRLQNGPPSFSKWEFSEEAGAYYWKLWFGPGFDFDLPGARAELERIEKFWLDTGLDGFMWDVGRVDEAMRYFAVELPKTYTSNDKWLTYERGGSASADAFAEFGLNAWFNGADTDTVNDYTRIVDGTTDADGLEAGLANTDRARELGATTHTWSIWGDEEFTNLIPHQYPTYPNDEVMRVQEAALLAGAGIHYGAGMYDQYTRWSSKLRSNWERVLRTVNANKALLPSADRVRVPAGSDPKAYAMRRTSEDGRQTALLIYNFNSTATNVTVDLTGTGIQTRQTPKDLYNGGRATAINGTSYTVRLPAYGFTMLEVSATAPRT